LSTAAGRPPLLVLSASDVRAVLGYAECADAMRSALASRARGEVFQPLRSVIKPDAAAGFMGLMPCYASGANAAYGLKAICVTPANPAAGLDAHQGVVLLSSPDTGEPLALLNASAVTEIRTAAVSAVATDLLAAPGADVLAIIGTGVQAAAHLRAIAATRPLTQIRVAGTTPAKAAAFAAAHAGAATSGQERVARVPVVPYDSARQAVAGAGIVVTATSSPTPVLQAGWLAPGTHVNAVGACLPHVRELDTATVAGAALFADSRESVLAESGDYRLAAAEAGLGPGHIRAEIGELLADLDGRQGRTTPDEITIFESLGLAVEDLAAAMVAYRTARDAGIGTSVEFA
jgi:ornithine cyclodeaminase/alanine dehydrogenase-like protein (mu-crystallin family)